MMMSSKGCLTTVVALLLVSGAQPEPRRLPAQDLSPRLLSFISMLNGYFSNAREVKGEKRFGDEIVQDVVNVTFRSVEVPALGPAPAIYFEEVNNGRLFRRMVLLLSEEEEGIIHCATYNFTDPSRPNEFDTHTLRNFNAERFEVPRHECDLVFIQVEDDVFVGTLPDCKTYDQSGKHPLYAFTVTCHQFSVVSGSQFSREQASNVPYHHIKYESYPLPSSLLKDAPDFQDPCQ